MRLSLFSCAYWPSVYIPYRNIYSSPLSIFELGCLFFCCWVLGVLYIFWILISYQIYNWKIFGFAYSVDCLFTLLTLSIDVQILKFSWSLNYLFFPFWPMPFMLYPTNHCNVMKCCPMFSSKSFKGFRFYIKAFDPCWVNFCIWC